jgi:hypothetical protein
MGWKRVRDENVACKLLCEFHFDVCPSRRSKTILGFRLISVAGRFFTFWTQTDSDLTTKSLSWQNQTFLCRIFGDLYSLNCTSAYVLTSVQVCSGKLCDACEIFPRSKTVLFYTSHIFVESLSTCRPVDIPTQILNKNCCCIVQAKKGKSLE